MKNKIKRLGTVLGIISLCLLTPGIARANSDKQVQYQYVTLSELSEVEKKQLIYDKPSETLLQSGQNIFYLVYDVSQDTKSLLPKTGEVSHIFWLVGLSVVGIACFIYKKGRKYLIVVLIGITSLSLQSALAVKSSLLSQYNKQFDYNASSGLPSAENIDGYRYIGYFVASGESSTTPDNITMVSTVDHETILLYQDMPVQYVDDNSMNQGETRVVEGKNGKEIVTYEVTYVNNVEVSRKEIKRERVEPVATVIYRGTKVVGSETTTVTQPSDEVSETTTQQTESSQTSSSQSETSTQSAPIESSETTQNTTTGQISQPKVKPIVRIKSAEKQDALRKVSVVYELEDTDSTYVRAVAKLYQGEQLVQSVDIPTLSVGENVPFELSNLDRNVIYTLKTELVYQLDNQEESHIEDSTYEFMLKLERLELKRVQDIKLFTENNEELHQLTAVPTDLGNLYARVTSEDMADIILNVAKIDEANRDGEDVFKVTAMTNYLVEDKNVDYKDGLTFYLPKAPVTTYDSFTKLIEAIRQNPEGTFALETNLVAKDTDLSGDYYFDGTFKGTLIGGTNDKQFYISGLKAPLFKAMENATVSHIDFKEVNINSTVEHIGTVAGVLTNSRVEDVAVSGQLSGPGNLGGVVSRMTQRSALSNVSFDGNIIVTRDADHYSGGIAGAVNSRSSIEKAKADLSITGRASSNGRRIAGLVGGLVDGATLKNSYVIGSVNNTGPGGQVGGVVGSLWTGGIVSNVVSYAQVTNGNLVYGDSGDTNANVTDAFYVTDVSSGKQDTLTRQPIGITQTEADEKVKSFGITAEVDQNFDKGIISTDFTKVPNYQSEREQVYKNIEKLLPYYTKEEIIKYGNLVDSSTMLYKKVVRAVEPLQNNEVVYDLATNKENVNQLLIVYTDDSVEKLPITYSQSFKDTTIQEYQITGTPLIYTPHILSKNYDVVDDLVNEFISLDYMNMVKTLRPNYSYFHYQGASQAKALGLPNPAREPSVSQGKQSLYDNNVDPYYLKQAFDSNKDQMKKHIIAMLEHDNIVDMTDKVSPSQKIAYIRENKEKILLGLAYMTRWYNFEVGGINVADMILYQSSVYGNHSSAIDFLISIGSTPLPSNIDDDLLMSDNTPKTFKAYIASRVGKRTVSEFLEYMKNMFDPNKTMNEWFKDTTKALIHEEQPTLPELSLVDVSIWKTLNKNSSYELMILPLLNLRHTGVAIGLTMNTLTMSMFEKYYPTPASGHYDDSPEIIEGMKQKLAESGKAMRLNAEMWYNILPSPKRDELHNLARVPVRSFDGYNAVANSSGQRSWMLATEAGEAPKTSSDLYATYSVKDFFAPIKEWRLSNGLGAYADGTNIYFIAYNIMDKVGSATMTHELTHNLDGSTYLLGYGRREGMGAEDFAQGMWHSIGDVTKDDSFGLNTDTDYQTYNGGKSMLLRLHNATPERIKSAADLQQYFKGTYDVLYLLNYVEAEEMLKLPKEDLRYLIGKVDKVADGTHYKDEFRAYTDDEWNSMTFNSIDDLIDNNAQVGKRTVGIVGRNAYGSENRFLANYGTYTTDHGAPGSRSFKQNSFELLGAAGYDGYVNYASNKLNREAQAEGRVFSDEYILEKTFNGQYRTFNEFRKAMYQERYNKRNQMKPFVYKNRRYSSYEEVKELFANAIQLDLARAKQGGNGAYNAENVKTLKRTIFMSYLRSTDDFRSSIFND